MIGNSLTVCRGLRCLTLLGLALLLTGQEAPYQLAVQETPVTTGLRGNYHYTANFMLVDEGGERLANLPWGVVIQKIDVSYHIVDAAGEDITLQQRPHGRHEAYYEVFTTRSNGYSHEADTFIDSSYPFGSRGSIEVWAAARAFLPRQKAAHLLQPHPDIARAEILLPMAMIFRARNRLTQAGDLPSTILHAEQAFLPELPRYAAATAPSGNLVVRHCRITWDDSEGDGRSRVYRSRISLSPPDRWPAFWHKHVEPSLTQDSPTTTIATVGNSP